VKERKNPSAEYVFDGIIGQDGLDKSLIVLVAIKLLQSLGIAKGQFIGEVFSLQIGHIVRLDVFSLLPHHIGLEAPISLSPFPEEFFLHTIGKSIQGLFVAHKAYGKGPRVMEKLRFEETVFRLAAHGVDVVHIVKKIVKRDNAFPVIVSEVKEVDMVGEKGFIHIQIADSLELILQNAFEFVVFLFSLPIIKKDAIDVAGKSNGTAPDPPIHPDEDGVIFNLQFQSDAIEEVSYQAKVHIGIELRSPEPAPPPSELLPVDHVDLFFENLVDGILSLADNNVQKIKDFHLVTAGHLLTMTLPNPENVLGFRVVGGGDDRLVYVHPCQ
jgi:hypothetical protein